MDELERRTQNITINQARPSNNAIQINTDENETNRTNPTIKHQKTHNYTKLPKNRPSLNILYANVKSIKKKGKIDEFKCIIKMIPKPVHFILLTETWTKTDDSNAESLKLENYNFKLSSRNAKRGGGVGAYILKGISYSTEKSYKNGNNYLWVKLDELNLNIGVVYYPGNTGKTTFLQDLKLQLQDKKDHQTVVVGDFNINLLEEGESGDYQKILSDTGFLTLNENSPEYFTRKDIKDNDKIKNSIIDHVHVSSKLGAGEYHVALIDSSLADHRQIYVEIREPQLLPTNQETNETINQSLSEIACNSNISDLENEMIRIINRIKSDHLDQGDWITEKICKGITLKNLFYRKYQTHPNKETRELFDKINDREIVKREAKKGDYKIATYIESGFNKRIVPSKLSVNSQTITDSNEICEQFNIYFSNITGLDHEPSDQPEIIFEVEDNQRNGLTEIKLCTAKEISEIIISLDPHASAGIDGISVENIKRSNKNINNDLSVYINKCLDAGFFPDCFKISKVMPIHTSGWKENLKYYTFESALPVISRIFEKLLWQRLKSFVPVLHYVIENKYGYRERPNTVSATINLISKINTSLDKKTIVLGLFINLNEALNKVNHSLLLKKLKSLGINGLALQILESYFVNRKYIVTMGGIESIPRKIKQGIPQGSILGHLLFLIYINDVQKLNLNGAITISAEKISLFYYGENVEDLVQGAQQDLSSVSKFFQDNGIVVEPKEIYDVIFTRKSKINRSKLYLNGIEIAEATQAEYFGLIVDSKLTWKPHVLKIKSLLKFYHQDLKSIGRCSRKQGLVFYNNCVRPHVNYLIEIWGAAPVAKTLLHGPHTKLNRKLNVIKSVQVLSIKRNIFYKTCIMVYNIIRWGTAMGITQVSFKTNEEVISKDTRSKNQLRVPSMQTKYGQQDIGYEGAVAYNGLPEAVRNARKGKIFKKELRCYMGVEKKVEHQQVQQIQQIPSQPGPSQAPPQNQISQSEGRTREVKKTVYKCMKCNTNEVFTSHQRNNHRAIEHSELKGKKLFKQVKRIYCH